MDQPSAKSPIAIIGAGIIGVSTAIWLQRAGHDVILVDRAGPGEGTSYGNGGMLASAAIIPVTVPGLLGKAPRMLLSRDEPLFLNWSYLPRLAPWLRRFLSHATVDETKRIAAALHGIIGDSLADHQALASGTEAEKWLVPSDYLFLYRDRAAFAADAFGWDIRRAHGFEWDEFEGQALRDYDPAFSPQIGFAVRLPRHGRIADPGRYVKDLAAHAQTQGAHILKAAVDDFVIEDGRVTGLRAAGETIRCSGVVLAAGIWSKELARKLGVNVPLESERGYHVELWEPSVIPRSPVMISSAKFVVTPMEGRLRLAGIVEFGGLDAPPSRAPFDLLMRNIRAAMPGLTWTETREWMGHRPTATDSIPLIGPSPKIAGAWLGFGHHHVGLTGGPKTGRLLAQMISGATPNIDMTPYEPARFV